MKIQEKTIVACDIKGDDLPKIVQFYLQKSAQTNYSIKKLTRPIGQEDKWRFEITGSEMAKMIQFYFLESKGVQCTSLTATKEGWHFEGNKEKEIPFMQMPLQEVLKKYADGENLTARGFNCIRAFEHAYKVSTPEEMLKHPKFKPGEMGLRNFGKKTYYEVLEFLEHPR